MNRTFSFLRKSDKTKAIFDMDDVLADLLGYVLPILNKKYNKCYAVDDIKDWSLEGYYGAGAEEVFSSENLFYNLPPKKDVLTEFPKIYRNPDFEVWIVTACKSPKIFIDKIRWIEHYFPDFPIDRVLPCREKDTVWGDVIIDDGIHNLIAYEYMGEPIVYDMLHNRYFSDGTKVHYKRVHCMRDTREYLESNYSKRVIA